METLKLGSRGDAVTNMQSYLILGGFLKGPADGVFGPKTELAVGKFQKAHGLQIDGVFGPKSSAVLYGVEPWIPRSYADVKTIFGDPWSKSFATEQIGFCVVDDSLKAFPKSRTYKARGFACHRLLVPVFQKVFNEIVSEGLGKLIYSYDGCWNVRKISGSTQASLHSWGIAIDLDYTGNELGKTNPMMDRRIVAIFNKHGFWWGGDFKSRKDGMHFEYFDRS